MGPLDVIDRLAGLGITLAVKKRAHGLVLLTDGPALIDDELAAGIRTNRTMLINIVLARTTGHTPAPCTVCGELSFVPFLKADGKARTEWPSCRPTPGCAGSHVPRPADVAQCADVAPPTQRQPPARPSSSRLLGPIPEWGAPAVGPKPCPCRVCSRLRSGAQP